MAIRNIVGNQEDVVRIDASGSATYDTWGTTGGSAGYGVLSNSTYFANGLWVGTTGDPVIAGVIGDTESDAPDVYADHGGTPQNQRIVFPRVRISRDARLSQIQPTIEAVRQISDIQLAFE